jgi:2-polyprenyl-6-methoxyphenol hydroxylase-like FAD-dependent oxidoreductase
METYIRPERGWALIPTNDDLTLLVLGWPYAEAAAYRADVQANYLKTLELVPEVAERVRAATRVERFTGGSVANYFRRPFGPGWALIGDAGYNKDPITAQGISDAFHDAERCADALDAVFSGRLSFGAAMSAYHQERDAKAMPIFEFTTQMAALEPPPPEMQQLLAGVHGNQAATDAFISVVAGTLSPLDFFDPGHLGAIMAAARARAGEPALA